MKIETINPATEEMLQRYDFMDSQTVNDIIDKGYDAYLSWKKTSFQERSKLMMNLSRLMKEKKQDLALLTSVQMGKPITQALAEIEKCASACEYFANNAESFLAPKIIKTDQNQTKVCYNPLGIVFAIMPWNFPYWQVFRFSVPTIMAGNAALLKHAPNVTGIAMEIENLYKQAGFPPHLFQQVTVDNDGAAQIIENPKVFAVTLTGSGRAGSSVAAHAGKFLKKSVLELGGSDPYVILEDADLDLAAKAIVTSRLTNAGQVCIAAKRIIVIKSIEEALTERITHYMSEFKMGNPIDPQVTLGPLARSDLRDTLHEQVQKSLKQGAKLLSGGIIPAGKGFYYPATLINQVKPGMPAFDEELFGPVIAIIAVDNEKEAIDLANQSHYGLGAAVFTRDLARGERIATQEIEAGSCFVNGFVVSDPRAPFGGIKQSGYGRELSKEGILEFVNVKTITISDS